MHLRPPPNRLTGAYYSTGEQFEYAYDAVGNRTVMTSTTPLNGTLVTTYTFDAANRLTDRAVSDGRFYTYDWSDRGQLLAEWTQGYPVRTFTYDGAGRLVEATVFTLTTRFTYTFASLSASNGLGARVAVEVVGQGTTTYTLDYAAGNRILAEETITGSTLYFYGHDCLGEHRDDEWLYYLNDVEGLVRQGADEQGQVVSGWLFDPDGTVLEGPEGPVSHLVCGGVYDWSTGLIYKDQNYFDPMLGIWLALAPLVVVQSWRGRKKKGQGFPWLFLLLLGVCVSGTLTACENGTPTPEDLATVCVEVPEFVSLEAEFLTGVNTPYLEDGYRYLALASPEGQAGIRFIAEVNVPQGAIGAATEFHWLQIVQEDREREFESGFVQRRGYGVGDNVDWMLDTTDPYLDSDPITHPGVWTGEAFDRPATPLELGPKDPQNEGELVRAIVKDEYKMFLMWSTRGIQTIGRVPLGVVEWGWEATAERATPEDEWMVLPNYHPQAGHIEVGSATSEMPVWLGNVRDLRWEPRQ